MNDLRLLLQADRNRKIINLQFKQISNLQMMMPILCKFENLESLSLNGNRLQTLPDMSTLTKLSELDISNNLFRDVQDVLPALKSLPQLTHLMYSFKNNEQENNLQRQLPKLERINKRPLNNMTLVSKKKSKKSSAFLKLNQKDLQDIALIYDDIRAVYRKSKYFVDKQLADEFDKGVDLIMGELSSKLSGAGSEEEVSYSIVGCRYALIDLCFVKMITYFYHFDKNIASIIERIHDYIAQSFKSMSQLQKESSEKVKAEIAQVTVKKEELFKTEIRRLKQIQEGQLNQLGQLESKNAQLLEKITKNSKQNVLQTSLNTLIKRKTRSPLKGRSSNSEQGGQLNIKLNKSLTLNQLKEIMGEIYYSKNKHNSICTSGGLPMQTLQTHMYTFLNQKYGLKPMTVEWAMSIVNGIKKYSQEDAEVAAFGKMLRNELEEDFIEVIKRNKLNIRQANRRFKGNDTSLVSLLESEEILLIAGFKREAIDLVLSRVRKENLQQGHIQPAYLQQLALQYTLRRHCERTRAVTHMFKGVDTDEDGIITQEQMLQMLEKVEAKPDMEIDQLMQLMDPFNTNAVTYSFFMENMLRIPNFKDAFPNPQ